RQRRKNQECRKGTRYERADDDGELRENCAANGNRRGSGGAAGGGSWCVGCQVAAETTNTRRSEAFCDERGDERGAARERGRGAESGRGNSRPRAGEEGPGTGARRSLARAV